jgi:hypothetical protein
MSTTNVVTTPNTKPKTPFATADEPISMSTCRRVAKNAGFVCLYSTVYDKSFLKGLCVQLLWLHL